MPLRRESRANKYNLRRRNTRTTRRTRCSDWFAQKQNPTLKVNSLTSRLEIGVPKMLYSPKLPGTASGPALLHRLPEPLLHSARGPRATCSCSDVSRALRTSGFGLGEDGPSLDPSTPARGDQPPRPQAPARASAVAWLKGRTTVCQGHKGTQNCRVGGRLSSRTLLPCDKECRPSHRPVCVLNI